MPIVAPARFLDVRRQLEGLDDESAIRLRARWLQRLVERGQKNPVVIAKAKQLRDLEAIHKYARDGIEYATESPDTYYDAAWTMRRRAGDCDDKSTLFCALAKAKGYRCGLSFIGTGPLYSHVLPYAYDGVGRKIYFETTVVRPNGWEPPHTKKYEVGV